MPKHVLLNNIEHAALRVDTRRTAALGDDAEIKGFCDTNYKVSFPLAGKVEILNRDRRHPFYKWIAAQIGEEALPRWNFHKFLIGKDGALEGAFSSQTPPLGVDIVGAVEKTLSA